MSHGRDDILEKFKNLEGSCDSDLLRDLQYHVFLHYDSQDREIDNLKEQLSFAERTLKIAEDSLDKLMYRGV